MKMEKGYIPYPYRLYVESVYSACSIQVVDHVSL